MAPLTPVYYETITNQMRALLRIIGQQPFAERFYLAGGTALALRLGHRRSIDLDFFSETDEVVGATRQEIGQALAFLSPQTVEAADGHLLLLIDTLYVGFFGYSYTLLEPAETVENVAVASMVDIGLMKLDALISRGSRKDFYDLYLILQHITLPDLFALGKQKYPYARDFELMAIESLVLFDNADRDAQPVMLIDLPWDTVRSFFIAEAQALGKSWFGDGG